MPLAEEGFVLAGDDLNRIARRRAMTDRARAVLEMFRREAVAKMRTFSICSVCKIFRNVRSPAQAHSIPSALSFPSSTYPASPAMIFSRKRILKLCPSVS